MPDDSYDAKTLGLGLAVFLCVLGASVGLYFLMDFGTQDRSREQARKDIGGLVTATTAYEIEYGALPLRQVARFEDEATQARLLQALQGLDPESNPKRIWFFEAGRAHKHGDPGNEKYYAGLHPDSGALLDPWGNPYRVRVVPEKSNRVETPYSDVQAQQLTTPAIAWSLGKDGVQGSPGKENILEGSDDVVSWR